MSAKHRKSSKRLAAKRAAFAAGAVGATAGISMMGAPAQAATAPNYSQAISDYSHALDNFLKAADGAQKNVNTVWGPISAGSGAILPSFGSSFVTSDATKITQLPEILRNIGGLTLPTGVPGVVPNIVLPGGQTVTLPLPATLPGGGLLVTAGNALDGLVNNPLVGPVLNQLPPLSQLIDGLEASQSKYTSAYNWGLLGLSGQTNFLNTFVKTPSGLTLNGITLPGLPGLPPITLPDIPVLPNGTLPQGSIWVPQGDGTYNFPLGGQIGWWGAAPTAAVKLPALLGGSDTVISVPIGAAGFKLPLNLLSAGTLGANVLLPTQNGVYNPIGFTLNNINTPIGFGLTHLNVTTGNYLGTNGINVNNGQNLMLLQNPLGIPLPLIYGLGGFSFGTAGMGIASPSLFGIKLFTDIKIGDTVGPNSSAGLIPPGILPTDPMNGIISTITGGLGVGSLTQILGIDALIINPLTGLLTPIYKGFSDFALKPISDFATSQYGTVVNGTAAGILDLSKRAADATAPAASGSPSATTTAPTTGAHALENGGESVSALTARIGANDQPAPKEKATATASDASSPATPTKAEPTSPSTPSTTVETPSTPTTAAESGSTGAGSTTGTNDSTAGNSSGSATDKAEAPAASTSDAAKDTASGSAGSTDTASSEKSAA
ncbi:Ribonucleases G and E OS=Tsukamurella paurometabola (strain ATCC 8368 / DSM / CCUG 35730 / CIP 100753 / JCM 10117 / KCTC 9821 / NBRC 16120 / NCIMB 702349/ NCTC 13040) OX=521096 GN=Tpau_2730 PE=4 SV=1 [Tsukamurella paurometabola]|uniref:Uncharacterized protein n=1 Tax=Tsukamurella paurometabola (strain ATCC 8368 / DSM 20162 / CCUG 35730 / CIP 100753 / JCM 10117 / KCTC 9821 / NBRC 16120 / NCIMB 702349 / NCTC 13040) TaxID=521096 RepID=D5USQ7_TSUPD|nr:hypothetical protein [Tsukamurella paurometabola]ADG79328.1 conserved hypothetical protein [Tsukamurella paurometabola DSM 20162]SUP35105.1 Uncharacterised protein [Tsukamurella paurometabola]